MDIIKEKDLDEDCKQVSNNVCVVYSCKNCNYAIEVIQSEEEIIQPCPCCECMDYKKVLLL